MLKQEVISRANNVRWILIKISSAVLHANPHVSRTSKLHHLIETIAPRCAHARDT